MKHIVGAVTSNGTERMVALCAVITVATYGSHDWQNKPTSCPGRVSLVATNSGSFLFV